jgi:hypothetical protein
MRVLSLDASTKSGWALFVDGKLSESGALAPVKVYDFNVNKDPQKSPNYPWNLMEAARDVYRLLRKVIWTHRPDKIVVENTNKGRNRHTQRILEFIHHDLLLELKEVPERLVYMDTSEWRSLVGLWMSKDDRKNNRDVKSGKKRGKISKKHLAVRMVNEKYGKQLKLKDNDEADAILMGQAYVNRSQK